MYFNGYSDTTTIYSYDINDSLCFSITSYIFQSLPACHISYLQDGPDVVVHCKARMLWYIG